MEFNFFIYFNLHLHGKDLRDKINTFATTNKIMAVGYCQFEYLQIFKKDI